MDDLTSTDEHRVALAGDWHGNVTWVQTILPKLHRAAPDVKTILHLGDFGIWPERRGKGFLKSVDYWCKKSGIERILVTLGNHEDHARMEKLWASRPGQVIELTDHIHVLPRPYFFRLGATRFLSLGGANSVDYMDRTVNRDWWLEEQITDTQVAAAMTGGPVDVMLTHETVNDGTLKVQQLLATNPIGFHSDELRYSAHSRAQVSQVWEALRPSILAHGHMHVPDGRDYGDGRRVYSLGCDTQKGNIALLTLDTLDVEMLA
ncbi:metallophosphoesterase family protein [Leifsonia sp. Leaf264]|uniref:metallophosphoesterase family protein n=1 Tax=Leifsonia sp. Leaf264 TaxID=1736314 RepID=UPI0006FC1A46|nr:metallophosphoesterase [Leifsonia sp. Leaf264]KQO98807.1 hypothetical protein ASF30_12150 [Leifsonia sp. Leaf264]